MLATVLERSVVHPLCKVAMTGELSLSGTLGPVIDVDVKYEVVEGGHVDVLMCPTANREDLERLGLDSERGLQTAATVQELVEKTMLVEGEEDPLVLRNHGKSLGLGVLSLCIRPRS